MPNERAASPLRPLALDRLVTMASRSMASNGLSNRRLTVCAAGRSSGSMDPVRHEVTNNAKSVKVDLAWELLRKMAAADPELAELLEITNQDWKTQGADVTRRADRVGRTVVRQDTART